MSSDTAHEGRIAGGYKATLSNPNTSDEAKQNASNVLSDIDQKGSDAIADHENERYDHEADHHTNQVRGGYKATLKNPNVSEEAKDHAREILDQ
ncbi:hypothetical protein IAR50_002440 [Cryptococcus sp. DSM 104548]